MITVTQALVQAGAVLRDAGIDGAPRDARLLMAHALGVDPGRVTLHGPDELTDAACTAFQAAVARRAAREPVSQILGHRDFYGRRFTVTSDVLDPRPETETLIAEALAAGFERALDMGTGSGAILITLLAERPSATGVASDLSPAALRIAEQNAVDLGVADRATFVASDWFDAIEGQFDLIVSNPPYIAADEMPDLAPELAFEPRMALTDEADGLTAYRAICAGAGAHLMPGGALMVEIGWQQASDVAAIFEQAGFAEVAIIRDLNGHDRVIRGKKAQ